MIGLYAFFYAFLHVSSYVGIDLQLDLMEFFKDIENRNYILVGMVSLILLVPLAVTSTKGMMKRLGGPRWKKASLPSLPNRHTGRPALFHDDSGRFFPTHTIRHRNFSSSRL